MGVQGFSCHYITLHLPDMGIYLFVVFYRLYETFTDSPNGGAAIKIWMPLKTK